MILDFAVFSVASIACWLELIGEYTAVLAKGVTELLVMMCGLAK